jgi:hypothetical protein
VKTATLVLASLLLESAAFAARFDEGTGKVVSDTSVFFFGFESTDNLAAIKMSDRMGNPLPATQLQMRIVTSTATAIEGAQAFTAGGTAYLTELDLRVLNLDQKLGGRRVEIKVWQRNQGQRMGPHVVWASGQNVIADLPFQLTGRGTDDGWQEWTSSPFDYALPGGQTASVLVFYANERSGTTNVGSMLDAISFDDLGPALVPNSACNISNEATTCGKSGTCVFGKCADASAMLGPVFQNPTLRADYLTRRTFEFTHLEGGRTSETKTQAFSATLQQMKTEQSIANYWTSMVTAIEGLEDAHASPPIAGYPLQAATGICVHLGAADMLPQGGNAPLVFATSTSAAPASMVKAGDALTAIDGMAVSDWVQAASRYVTFFGDPAARNLVSTPFILNAAATTGAVLTFSRPMCTTAPCTAAQIQTITIDLGAMEQGFWTGNAPAWLADPIACDYRFHRAFAGPTGTDYTFAGSSDSMGVRTIQINGVPGQSMQGGPQWFMNIDTAFTNAPRKLILDERTGFGGGIDAVDHIASYMVRTADFDKMEMLPQITQSVDENLISLLAGCQVRETNTSTGSLAGCGDYLEWKLGSMAATNQGLAGTSSVAVLIGYDVSGNDFLTKLLTYRKAGRTRIFGGAPTAGGFGVIWQLPVVSNETSGGSLQVQDSIFRTTESDVNLMFQTSSGVRPDVTILQKQSDCVRNVDTLVTAAMAWLNG